MWRTTTGGPYAYRIVVKLRSCIYAMGFLPCFVSFFIHPFHPSYCNYSSRINASMIGKRFGDHLGPGTSAKPEVPSLPPLARRSSPRALHYILFFPEISPDKLSYNPIFIRRIAPFCLPIVALSSYFTFILFPFFAPCYC